MIDFQQNPAFDEEMRADVEVLMFAAAEGATEGLRYRLLADSQSRSGRKYAKYPRISSRYGEYPQEQSGELVRGVGVQVGREKMEYAVGIFGVDEEKLMYLEFTGAGVRRPLFMYFEGRDSGETIADMNRAVESTGAGSR